MPKNPWPTYAAVLVVLSIMALLVYFVMTPRPGVKKRVYRSHCMGNLRTLGQHALLYAEQHGQNFPVAQGENPRAHASLQMLVDTMPESRDPTLFVCPCSDDVPAVPGSDGRLQLTEKNVSYAWRGAPLKSMGASGTSTVLACDKSLENHDGTGVNVLYVDAAVRFWTKDELGAGGLEGFMAKHGLVK